MSAPAFSEESAGSQVRRSAVLEQVIVTARKIEESAQDVPIAITALSAELTNPTIRNLTDLNGFAPNVQIGEDGSRSGGGASITIRGISPTRTDDNSFDSPIGVMIDGIYLGSLAGQVLENFDIERVEVLRGPQGTLFGRNTVGGVVHAIRTRPTGELGARVKATLGNDGQQEFRFVGNAPIIQDVLAAKVFMTTQQADGFLDNTTIGGQVGDTDYKNYGVTLLLTPADEFEATLTVERFDDTSELNAYHVNANYAPGVLPPPAAGDLNSPDYSDGFLNCLLGLGGAWPGIDDVCRTSTKIPGKAQNDTDNNAELETDAYTLNMSLELNEHMSLVSVTGYRDQREYRIFDFDGSAAPFITIERWNDYDQFSQEFRIDGVWDTVRMTSGVYYWNSEFTQDWVTGGRFWATLFGGVATNPGPATDPGTWANCQAGGIAPIFCDTSVPVFAPLAPGVPVPIDDVTQILYETQETTSIAFFSQVDWTFVEDWTLTAGLRWTEERKDFRAGQAYLSNVAQQRARNFPEYADLDNTWREVSPRLGITYRINDSSMVYASYAEGFHSGGFFGVNQNTRDFERDQYDPEFADSYEIGYKSTHLDDRLRLNVTVFRMDFTDKQEQSIQEDPDTASVVTVFDNVADARYQGLELETEYVFADWFRAFLNYGYLDAEYSEFETDTNNDGIIDDASDLTPRNAPESTVGVGGTFSWPIGPGSLEIYGKYAWIDEVETSLLNTPQGKLDDRKDVTASIGYYTERWSVVAFGRNLTDEEYEIFTPIGGSPTATCEQNPVEPNCTGLFAVGSLNRPRTYGVEVEYNF
jgi:iron complex outermembrane recepter protein